MFTGVKENLVTGTGTTPTLLSFECEKFCGNHVIKLTFRNMDQIHKERVGNNTKLRRLKLGLGRAITRLSPKSIEIDILLISIA